MALGFPRLPSDGALGLAVLRRCMNATRRGFKKNPAAPSEGSDGNGGLGRGARSDAQSFQSRTQPNSGIQHGGLTLRGRGGGWGENTPGRQTQSSEKQREKSPHNGSERCFASRTRQTSSHSLHNPGSTRMQSCVGSAQLKGRDKQRWRGPANENKCPHHLSIALALPCSASISGGVGSWSLSPFEQDSAKTRVGAVHGTALRWRYQASMAPR